MKKILYSKVKLLAVLTFLLVSSALINVKAQTVVWSDNFDTPSGGTNNNNAGVGWTLNSEGNTSNRWFIVAPPSNLGCTSTGRQLHISCDDFICGLIFGGPETPVYNAASSNNRSAVSPNISTVGQANLTLSFEFVCNGEAGEDYGLLAFSSNGGASWNEFPERYEEVASCSTKTITMPAQYLNIPNFKIRFRWVESVVSGFDPPSSIDNIRLTSPTATCTPPTVNAGANVSICAGQPTTIGGSPTATGGNPANYVYTWTPATGLSSTTVANPTASPSSTTTYTVSVNGGDVACTATSTVTVTVNTPDALNVAPAGNQTICPGGSVQLTAANGFTNYSWTTPSGVVSGQTVTATLPGNYLVTATDPDGCLSTSSTTQVAVTTIPNLSISSSSDFNICSGESVTLSGTNGFTNYVWSTPSGQQTGNSISASAAGSYGLTATFGTCSVAANSATLVLVSAPSLTTAPVGSVTFCPGQSVSLTGVPGFTNYSWSTPSGTQTGVTINGSAAGNYTLSADFSGCTVVAAPVTLNPIVVPALTTTPAGLVEICPGETPSISANSGFSNYVWTTPIGSSSGSNVTASSDGAYSVSANFLGCTVSSAVVTIETVVIPALVITANGSSTICPGESLQLSASSGFANYNWNTPSGNASGNSISAQLVGNYSVSATFSGCAANSNVFALSWVSTPALTTTPAGSVSICTGNNVNITAVSGFTNYTWNTPSGNEAGLSITADQTGSYQVSADFEQCTVVSEPISVILSPPFQISVTPAGPIDLCEGETVTLQAQSGFANYQWSTSEVGQSLEVGLTGGYSVSASNLQGCEGTSGIVQVNQIDNPVAGFTYQQNLDELYEINFTNTSQNATNYLWNFGSGNTSTEENPNFTFAFDNTWPVSLVVSNACGSDTIETGVVVIKTSLEDIDGLEVSVLQLPDGSLQINGNLDVAQVLTLDIMALNGQLLWHGSTGKSNVVNIQVPILDGAEGLYFIRIQSGDKARIMRYLRQ